LRSLNPAGDATLVRHDAAGRRHNHRPPGRRDLSDPFGTNGFAGRQQRQFFAELAEALDHFGNVEYFDKPAAGAERADFSGKVFIGRDAGESLGIVRLDGVDIGGVDDLVAEIDRVLHGRSKWLEKKKEKQLPGALHVCRSSQYISI
jgi:hypothetical protein